MSGGDLVGKEVEALYVSGDSTGIKGRVISWSDQPIIVIQLPDGTRKSWRADMVRTGPAVELPTEPTLGWLSWTAANGGQATTLATWRFDRVSMDSSTHATNEWGYVVNDIDEKVTAWVAATAIPTDALDRFMRVRRTPGATLGDINEASRIFAAAIDKAADQ